jgi:hypothetical protein
VSLRQQAAADFLAIAEDTTGFGWPITVTNPSGQTLAMTGLSTDVGNTIDPETGVLVAGRKASVALSVKRLEDAGLGIPTNEADPKRKPWVVVFNDIGGTARTYAVLNVMPDRALGCVTCELGVHRL